jgi:hypothetical protein
LFGWHYKSSLSGSLRVRGVLEESQSNGGNSLQVPAPNHVLLGYSDRLKKGQRIQD